MTTAQNWPQVARAMQRLRKERGWSKAELSRRSSVSENTIRDIECARGKPRRRTLEDLSRALGRPKNYLGEILAGRQPTSTADAAGPGSQAFLDMLDNLLVKRLTELAAGAAPAPGRMLAPRHQPLPRPRI